MLPGQLQNLIYQFTKLPGIGPRQAARFAFYLLRDENEISSLENVLRTVRENTGLCDNCFLPAHSNKATQPNQYLCSICANQRRDENILCIVEKETDALNIEKSKQFGGRYFVLGGFIDPLEPEGLAYKRLNILLTRLYRGQTPVKIGTELILALTPRREGEFTSTYIEEQIKNIPNPPKITRLARGLSSGAELEYADEDTLRNALGGRK